MIDSEVATTGLQILPTKLMSVSFNTAPQSIVYLRLQKREREMDQGVVSILKLLLFVIMATTIVLDIVTAATVSSSMKKPFNHLVFNRVLDDDDFVLSQIEVKLEESEFTASMDALPDRKDVEALVSFRNGVKFDPYGSLLKWTPKTQRQCAPGMESTA